MNTFPYDTSTMWCQAAFLWIKDFCGVVAGIVLLQAPSIPPADTADDVQGHLKLLLAQTTPYELHTYVQVDTDDADADNPQTFLSALVFATYVDDLAVALFFVALSLEQIEIFLTEPSSILLSANVAVTAGGVVIDVRW